MIVAGNPNETRVEMKMAPHFDINNERIGNVILATVFIDKNRLDETNKEGLVVFDFAIMDLAALTEMINNFNGG